MIRKILTVTTAAVIFMFAMGITTVKFLAEKFRR